MRAIEREFPAIDYRATSRLRRDLQLGIERLSLDLRLMHVLGDQRSFKQKICQPTFVLKHQIGGQIAEDSAALQIVTGELNTVREYVYKNYAGTQLPAVLTEAQQVLIDCAKSGDPIEFDHKSNAIVSPYLPFSDVVRRAKELLKPLEDKMDKFDKPLFYGSWAGEKDGIVSLVCRQRSWTVFETVLTLRENLPGEVEVIERLRPGPSRPRTLGFMRSDHVPEFIDRFLNERGVVGQPLYQMREKGSRENLLVARAVALA